MSPDKVFYILIFIHIYIFITKQFQRRFALKFYSKLNKSGHANIKDNSKRLNKLYEVVVHTDINNFFIENQGCNAFFLSKIRYLNPNLVISITHNFNDRLTKDLLMQFLIYLPCFLRTVKIIYKKIEVYNNSVS